MDRHGVPTMKSGAFDSPAEAKRFAAELGGGCAVKADGLALGKGVLVCISQDEAEKAIDTIMTDRAFGNAGNRVLIQEFLEGMEISLHALCDGRTTKLFPSSQDHKRALDGDQGLNTGGMGTYSPVPFLSDAKLHEIADQILGPWLEGCQKEGIDFRGMIYPGLMLTSEGPKVLEFNARFGDPETQIYLTRLENDLLDLLEASVDGTLEQHELRWSTQSSVCVVMASGGARVFSVDPLTGQECENERCVPPEDLSAAEIAAAAAEAEEVDPMGALLPPLGPLPPLAAPDSLGSAVLPTRRILAIR